MTEHTLNINVTSNLPGAGVVTETVQAVSPREYLRNKGVDTANATVMVNGVAANLDEVLKDGDRVTVSRDGKSA